MLISRLKLICYLCFTICLGTFSSKANTSLTAFPQDTSCLALFAYMPIDGNTIELFNLSLGDYSEVIWEMGDGMIYTNPAQPLVHSYEQPGYYNVCLTIQDTLSCLSEFCLPVLTIPEDILCKETDCVLPGDTDLDGQINIFDALAIGLGFNLEGTPRPDATIEAIFQAAFDWLASLVNGFDAKHADCDGNGIINDSDFIAIEQNYQRVEKNDSLLLDPIQPTVSLTFEQDTLILENAAGNPIPVKATLTIGSEAQPIEDFYGIALSFNYPKNQVQEVSSTLTPNTALPTESIFHADKVVDKEQYGVIISQTQQIGTSTYGPIAEVGFVIIEDLFDARTINIGINDVKVINSKGQELPVTVQSDSIRLTILSTENRSVLTNTNEVLDANISISPNPASDHLQITLEGPIKHQEGQLVIYNSIGERMIAQQTILNQTSLDITSLPMGIYWVELLFEEGRISRKVIRGY